MGKKKKTGLKRVKSNSHGESLLPLEVQSSKTGQVNLFLNVCNAKVLFPHTDDRQCVKNKVRDFLPTPHHLVETS